MIQNKLKSKLKEGKAAIGTFMVCSRKFSAFNQSSRA